MAATTIYRLSEQVSRLLEGGDIPLSAQPSLAELKIAIGQVINEMLKIDYFQVNMLRGEDRERIPNGSVLGLYENIAVESWNGVSRCDLPVKPIKLPRNMGIFAVYPKWQTDGNVDFDSEFIPLQMGQSGMLKSQKLISGLLGQVGYENFGGHLVFTRDLTQISEQITLAIRLVIMDISQYDDYTHLPILPEMEAEVIRKVVGLFANQPVADKVVDPSQSQQVGIPITQQRIP
jgi:hypothetical protein